MSLIEVQGVSKSFRLQAQPKLIREHLRDRFRRSNDESATELFALRDVSFTVERGESLALVGRNGAGKSTLLSLVAGVAEPDAGRVAVTGRIAALLALGSGFHPDLTGRENMMLNAALLGFTEQQARQLFPRVVEFAELQEFIDEPMRSYSAGMTMRLAFAIAIQLDPDVLILDEVLAVGDAAFQGKCQQAITELRERGRTLFLVSHSPHLVLAFCDKAVWLEQGQVVRHGPARDVVTEYTERLSTPDRSLPARQDKPVETAVPHPNLRPAKSAVGGRRG